MEIFNPEQIPAFPIRDKHKNVFFQTSEFKMRIIELDKGEEIPECKMDSYVIFSVISGKVEILSDSKRAILTKGLMMVSGPATFSMKAITKSRITGIQITKMC